MNESGRRLRMRVTGESGAVQGSLCERTRLDAFKNVTGKPDLVKSQVLPTPSSSYVPYFREVDRIIRLGAQTCSRTWAACLYGSQERDVDSSVHSGVGRQ